MGHKPAPACNRTYASTPGAQWASATAPALVAPAPAMLELAPRGGCLTLLCCAAAASSDVQLVPNGAITPDSATYITLVEVEQPTKAATSIVRPNTIETGGVITVASAVFASTVAPGCTPANPICSSADACCQPNMASESDWSQHRRNLRAAHAAADAMTPADKMPPAPADAIAPANADAIALANADAMTSANADAMTSANADAMTPANVEPASFSVLTTRTQMGGGGDSLEEGMEKRRPQAPLSQGTRRGTAPQLCRSARSSKTGSVVFGSYSAWAKRTELLTGSVVFDSQRRIAPRGGCRSSSPPNPTGGA